MKVSIYDHDIDCAARLASVLQAMQVEVYYCEKLQNKDTQESALVIADPYPETTVEWLSQFRAIYANKALLIITQNADILLASARDSCYSMTKPLAYKEVVEIVKAEMFGGKVIFNGTKGG